MTCITSSEKLGSGFCRQGEFIRLPSRADGIARSLRKAFGQDDAVPDELAALIDRLKRINA